jgi:hypothetical protein
MTIGQSENSEVEVADKPWIEDYRSDGRRLKDRELEELTDMWYAAGRRANSRNQQIATLGFREMDDIEAEFNLRGLEAPGPRKH